MTQPVRIAQLSCGPEYSGIQHEIDEAAREVGGEIFYPDVALKDIRRDFAKFWLDVKSPDLKLAIARAMALVEGRVEADAVFIATCFRCAEAAIVRNELRRYINEHSRLPVVSYSFTERTTAGTLLTRMEALTTIARRRALLARETQKGLTLGLDSGSATTKAVVMKDNKIIGTGWQPTTEVLKSAQEVIAHALTEAGVTRDEMQAVGTTGYGRFLVGKEINADLIQEELTVNSKGAVYLANRQHGPATVIDIGGMDNKAISVMDGIPGVFTMGGICAGASGRFLEMTAKRLGVDITELGPLSMKGFGGRVPMNSYCIVFGTQSLVNALSAGSTREDVAAAACHSVAEQVYEQQLQEVDIKEPVIMVGGTSLIEGLVFARGEILQTKIVVPPYSQYIGAVGSALLASGFIQDDQMLAVEYFEVECPEPVGAEYYKQITNDVLLDHNLLRVIEKLHISIDPKIPVFIAVGVLKPITTVVRVGDIANINPQEGKMTLVITEETYLASMLNIFWERFGKDRVEQPDRFTVILYNVQVEAKKIEAIVIGHPSESLHRDLIYALRCVAPEGFRLRSERFENGKFSFVASENTLMENIDELIKAKFALMGETP